MNTLSLLFNNEKKYPKHSCIFKTCLTSMFCFLVVVTNANYIKGYVIDNKKEKIECYIKNQFWKQYDDTLLEYKLTIDGQSIFINFDSICEVVLQNKKAEIRFATFMGNFDKSGTEMGRSESREPEWIVKRMFLKVLVQGKANLYCYDNGSISRFYVKIDSFQIEPLICKEYVTTREGFEKNTIDASGKLITDPRSSYYVVRVNTDYKKQIWDLLNFENKDFDKVQRLDYKQDDMIGYVKEYNTFFEKPHHK